MFAKLSGLEATQDVVWVTFALSPSDARAQHDPAKQP
jgi:hypothetical protein